MAMAILTDTQFLLRQFKMFKFNRTLQLMLATRLLYRLFRSSISSSLLVSSCSKSLLFCLRSDKIKFSRSLRLGWYHWQSRGKCINLNFIRFLCSQCAWFRFRFSNLFNGR